MGCNASVSNDQIEQITDEQIQQIRDGTISPISYRIFLNNFSFVSRYPKFYTNLPLEKQIEVFDSIGPLSKDECKIIVENICKNSESEETLVSTLQQVTRKLICETKIEGQDSTVYLPVGLDKKLWKSIVQKKYDTQFGKFKVTESIGDFDNNEVTRSRDIFIGDMQNNIPQVQHNKDLSLLIQSNTIDNLWKKEVSEDNLSQIDRDAKKPFMWEPNIHQAAYKGKKSSVQYDLALIPQLLNLPDYKDNTPVHYAAMGNQKNMLIYLHEINADFSQPNDDGFLPIHLVSNKGVIKSLNDLGLDINTRNANGESLLDIKTRTFDKGMIKTMLGLGVNILEPNPDGAFWIQTALHKQYYCDSMKEDKFIDFVRKQLINNKTALWNDDPIYQEVISRKDKTHTKEDLEDLNESLLKQDMNRVKVLLAIGTKPDERLKTGETNLYLCAKRGLSESCKILIENYCDPNFTNSQKENTFWVATINEHFDTALVLRDHGANMNLLDANGETIMHNVYRRKIQKVFEFVLEAGASPNVKNNKCQTVTFIAFLNRDDEVAEMIQDKYNGDINAQDHHFDSLVHLAFAQGDLKRIEYLSSRKIDMDLKNNKGHSVLMVAYFTEVNFQTWDFLIQQGASVSIGDYKNNTMLHHLFFQKKPREDIYRFLMDHKIDYNIENNDGQFPISITIEMSHDTFGFELLNLGCKIIDPKSVHEPIAEALKRGSQKWFEALVDHGADGMNEKVGIISRYINSNFFKYKIFKKIPRMNVFLEAPLQMAIYKKYNNCANDLWGMAKEEKVQISLANNKDCYGRVVLSSAIIAQNERFADMLIDKKYDCETPDNDGRTPFIHACAADVINWMNSLFEIIPLSNANMKDKDNYSGLSFAAEHNRKSFCDYLFCNDIEVFDIMTDSNGIIDHYQDLITRFRRAREEAGKNTRDAREALREVEKDLEEVERRRNELNSQISDLNRELSNLSNNSTTTSWDISRVESKLKDCEKSREKYIQFRNRIQRDLLHAQEIYNYYESRSRQFDDVTRTDILHNIGRYESLAYRDRKIGEREFFIDWSKIGALAMGVLTAAIFI